MTANNDTTATPGSHDYIASRQVELGRCDRGYGKPCERGHQCIGCPALRLLDGSEDRLHRELEAIGTRRREAETNGWIGEIEGLDERETAIKGSLRSLAHRAALKAIEPDLDHYATFTLIPLTPADPRN